MKLIKLFTGVYYRLPSSPVKKRAAIYATGCSSRSQTSRYGRLDVIPATNEHPQVSIPLEGYIVTVPGHTRLLVPSGLRALSQ